MAVIRSTLPAFTTLVTGLLAGAFGYGAANVVPTFGVVPLDVRLTFHTAMMRVNEPVMQTAMALAILTTIALTLASRGTTRRLAATAASSALTTLLITVFGNIPLHAHIRRWATTPPTTGYEDILQRWETFHTLRTLTALATFTLVILATRAHDRDASEN
ncbi:anthrone oxygenase family protein [Nonomuraea sp. NPDC050643]|uniref:anthrone oxygenase family protein n=1 Tax=Nonomuraea sp. NPDC050643 TaxID=3155660 RepID=UPI0033D0DA48